MLHGQISNQRSSSVIDFHGYISQILLTNRYAAQDRLRGQANHRHGLHYITIVLRATSPQQLRDNMIRQVVDFQLCEHINHASIMFPVIKLASIAAQALICPVTSRALIVSAHHEGVLGKFRFRKEMTSVCLNSFEWSCRACFH